MVDNRGISEALEALRNSPPAPDLNELEDKQVILELIAGSTKYTNVEDRELAMEVSKDGRGVRLVGCMTGGGYIVGFRIPMSAVNITHEYTS